MAHMTWRIGEGWSEGRIEPYGKVELWPAASVLHYAQEVFEGLKAYRRADGSVWTFRPQANAARFVRSAQRMALPELDPADFLASSTSLVQVDREWVPTAPDTSLYLRPFMYAAEPFIGVKPAEVVEYYVIASPVGSYFDGGVAPVAIWVERDLHRAAAGGTGAAKCGGNYAGAMQAQVIAYQHACEQVLFLDAATNTYLEELGGMNVLVFFEDGTAATPPLGGTILEGITRDSILTLMREQGMVIEERPIPLAELLDGLASGRVAEVAACGTAAVLTPIGRLAGEGFDFTVGTGAPGERTMAIRDHLTAIQYGQAPDPYGWTHRLV